MPQHRCDGEVTSQSPFSLWERLGHVGEQYQCPNPAAACTQDAHPDPDAVMGRLTPPLQVCPWDGHNASVLLLLLPPTHTVPSQWQEVPVSSSWSLMVLMLRSMGPRGAGAARALLQLRGAGSTRLVRETTCVGAAAADPRKGRVLLAPQGMKGSCKGSAVIHKMMLE